jgi:hypothetical protein
MSLGAGTNEDAERFGGLGNRSCRAEHQSGETKQLFHVFRDGSDSTHGKESLPKIKIAAQRLG